MAESRPMHWRLRRGMRELDVLLSRWYEEEHAGAGDALRAGFDTLLDQEDPDIWNWLMGRQAVPDELAGIVAALRRDTLA